MRDMRVWAGCVAGAVSILISAGAARAVTFTEPGSGELSENPNTPTSLGSFGLGTHSITAISAFGDQDDFTFSIPAGLTLSEIKPFSYAGVDQTAFIGLASGTSIPNQGGAPGNLLGYTHFGPGSVGQNILDDIGAAGDAMGFTPPLGPGNYSVWTQQAGLEATYRLDFIVTPEPSGLALLGLAGLGLARRRRRPVGS